jgi:hypothetical protein
LRASTAAYSAREPPPPAVPELAAKSAVAPSASPAHVVKTLLREPLKDIELDDYVTGLADAARAACLDIARFPTPERGIFRRDRRAIAEEYIERCDAYWHIVRTTCEALLTGCAWGKVKNESLWGSSVSAPPYVDRVRMPRPNERSGPLIVHVWQGRVYRSPLAATGVLTIADWIRDDLPGSVVARSGVGRTPLRQLG